MITVSEIKNTAPIQIVARVSFAPADMVETMPGTKVGMAIVFSAMLNSACDVQVILAKAVISEEWYGCSDDITTGYMKIKTDDILYKLLPHTKHSYQVIVV